MTAGALDAVAELALGLEPLDWVVVVAGAVALVVLLLELRRGRGPLTPGEAP